MAGDTQVVLLTPPGRAAVATLLVAGPRALEVVARHFRPAGSKPLNAQPLRRIVFGRWGLGAAGEEVVVCRTMADTIEIHGHGGRAASRAILQSLVSDGLRETDWRDWIRESHADPIAADVRIALADAPTERTAALLCAQTVALRDAFDAIDRLIAAGDQQQALERVQSLLDGARVGRHLTAPWRVVLAGAPNVGKSSLINALLGYQRAIVHATPGTTRDLVSAPAALAGWPVEFIDTAGIRAAGEPLEMAGIELARQQAATADLVLVVLDGSRPATDEEKLLATRWPHALLVRNKCDLPAANLELGSAIEVSALTGQKVSKLTEAIAGRLVPASVDAGAALPFLEPQIAMLARLRAALLAGERTLASSVLAEYAVR